MNLVTRNPFSLLNELQRDMNRLFDTRLLGGTELSSVRSFDWVPTVDIHEDDAAYHFEVDLPGVNRDDIEITAHNGILSIKGTRHAVHEDKEKKRSERYYGTFLREFSMPENADLDNVQAKCENGVLAISVPKVAQSEPKRVTVQ
ncbi:MAG: Hsp20/alpha crystallin family protein [Spongiibacteraceae bacterium]|nr:Hsp20/alpha crystallin family protein [Spongiibacteraceae bacterium]